MLALASTLALPPSALANPEKVCPFPGWPNRCVWPGLEEGDRVPGVGDLFTVGYALWLNHEVDSIQTRIDAAVTATAAAYREDLKYQARVHAADNEAKDKIHKAEIDSLKSQLPGFWGHPVTVATLASVVVAVVVTVLYVGTGAGQRLRDEVAGIR